MSPARSGVLINASLLVASLLATSLFAATPALADSIVFSTGFATNQMAMASRPDSAGKGEREAADDFLLGATTSITGASFTGLVVGAGGAAPTIDQVVVDIYRIFPKDSDTSRTPHVPTRTNSLSDLAFASRDSSAGGVAFSTSLLSTSFTASNSVLDGINPSPNQTTGGDGPVTGSEVQFNLSFATPFMLGADHYFFVPQVQVTNGEFYWLSATAGTAFAPDLQTWARRGLIDPDWLRVGTDIVGTGTFNAAFSLTGNVVAVPEPQTWALMLGGLGMLLAGRRKQR